MPNLRAWKPMHHKKWLLPLLMFFPWAIEVEVRTEHPS